jgi:hypothetical protein
MKSPNKILEQVYLMCMARTSMCITLPIILQSFLFITQKEILEKTISKTLKSKRMKMMNERERERERERDKSSSITLAQDMVSWE